MQTKAITSLQNEEIIQGLREGKHAMYERVFKFYYEKLCGFASNYLTEIEECENIVQDVMMWLWENRTELNEDFQLKSLLFTMVKNKCINRITHLQMRSQVHEKLKAKLEMQFEDPNFYLTEELTHILEKAIDALPEDYRTAFKMNRFEDMSYNEIASALGVSPKTIAYRISQALKILRVACKDYLPLLIFLSY